jgi:hypothetical protein
MSADRTGPDSSVPLVPPDDRMETRGHQHDSWQVVVPIVAAASLIAWFRMPSMVRGWLYAEDGKQFAADWAGADAAGGISVLWTPYAGYEHAIPRLASWFVTAVLPVSWWGIAINVISCLTVGAVAGLIFVFSRDVVTDLACRVVIGMITVLVPIAATEALGNIANLHWFLLYLTPWLLLVTPRTSWGASGIALVAFFSTTTEPQCAIFLPLVLWRVYGLWRPTDPESRRLMIPVLCGWFLGVAAQVVATFAAPRGVSGEFPPLASVVQGYVLNAGMTLGTTYRPLLGSVFVRFGWWPGYLGVAAILALAVLGFVKGRTSERIALVALLYGSVVSWTASFVLSRNPDFYYSELPLEEFASPLYTRWGTAASMMLAATIPVAVAVLIREYRRRQWIWYAVLGALVIALAANLFLDTGPGYGSWAAEVERARAVCATANGSSAGTVELTTPPGPGWVINLPCPVLTGG